MKIFSHCPKCHKPMLNTECGPHLSRWRLSCQSIDHDILALTPSGQFEMIENLRIAIFMGIYLDNRVYTDWNFPKKELCITEGMFGPSFYIPNSVIPFFEPDLSNYDKLIRKIKSYLAFS